MDHRITSHPAEARFRSRSLWLDTVPDSLAPRHALTTLKQADVAIIGAGLTGLWTAYELLVKDPSLDVVVIEAEVAGFGAFGPERWLVFGALRREPGGHRRDPWPRGCGRVATRAMFDTVDEVGRCPRTRRDRRGLPQRWNPRTRHVCTARRTAASAGRVRTELGLRSRGRTLAVRR